MDEYGKIAKLLEEGKITPEEAEKLLVALDEAGDPAPAAPMTSRSSLRVRLDRADLHLRVDPEASEPRIVDAEGMKLRLDRKGEVWELTQAQKWPISFFNLAAKRRSLVLALPSGMGLELNIGQGSLEAEGPLPFLKAQLGQGRLRFERADGLSISLAQGSVEGNARINEGVHQIKLGMGEVKLTLLEGSDLRLALKTALGEVALSGGLHGEGRGNNFSGALGEGRWLLKVSLGMGNVEVQTP